MRGVSRQIPLLHVRPGFPRCRHWRPHRRSWRPGHLARCEPGDERDGGTKRYPELPGQSYKAGRGGQRNRSHQPCPRIFLAPSVTRADLVRGSSGPRPWPVPPPSVARTAPESAAHGRITDGGNPKIAPRSASVLVSGECLEQEDRAEKPSAQPTLVRTQHLPRCFRRSKPVSLDGGTGFCVPLRAVRGPLVKVFGPAVGQIRVSGSCSILVLIPALSRGKVCSRQYCFGVRPLVVGLGLRAVGGPGGKSTDA
jgi:hypothetical protein